MTEKIQRILPTVQKPARYTGGEYNEIRKNVEDVRGRQECRMGCRPDVKKYNHSDQGNQNAQIIFKI